MKKSEIMSALDTLPEDNVSIDDVVQRLVLVEDIKKESNLPKKGIPYPMKKLRNE